MEEAEHKMQCLDWLVVREIATTDKVSSMGFCSGLEVWLRRPHVLNRRLGAVNDLTRLYLSGAYEKDRWKKLSVDLVDEKIHEKCKRRVELVDLLTNECGLVSDEVQSCGVYVEIRELLPKPTRGCHVDKLMEFLVIDQLAHVAAFIPWPSNWTGNVNSGFTSPNHSYAFRFIKEDSIFQLLIWSYEHSSLEIRPSVDIEWVGAKVLPKIVQWAKDYDTDFASTSSTKRSPPSLSLISAMDYMLMYNQLKTKYGPHLVEIWPETTDPSKFVYEDIAIASYLLILWDAERKLLSLTEKQNFIDLGCGNGLLSHILSSEGYPGVGVDVQRRKIWDLYGPNTKLIEGSITPSSDSLFPEYDWIIGNHSDELTPWIPIIAARSSRKMRFFLIPCCAHNFDAKFQRRNSQISQYEDYLEYVSEIGRICGFNVEKDKLRIPSTKRICLIGRTRSYESSEWPDVDLRITEFVDSQSCLQRKTGRSEFKDDGLGQWAANFKTRSAVQLTRNCTSIENSVKEHIIRLVFDALLLSPNGCSVDGKSGQWRSGGCIDLAELVKLIEPNILQKLKNECGGLQTLLRNHYYIFHVVQGTVRLRNYLEGDPHPRKGKNRKKPTTGKVTKKLCWFHANHPDGCPIDADKCKFLHSAYPQPSS